MSINELRKAGTALEYAAQASALENTNIALTPSQALHIAQLLLSSATELANFEARDIHDTEDGSSAKIRAIA